MILGLLAGLVAQAAPVEDWVRQLDEDEIERRVTAESRLRQLFQDCREAVCQLKATRPEGGPRLQRVRTSLQDLLSPLYTPVGAEDEDPCACLEEDEVTDEDLEILQALRRIRITIDMTKAPLESVVEYFREISGLNTHLSGVEAPDSMMLSAELADVTCDAFLRHILTPLDFTYTVRDGVILIAPLAALRKQLRLELYDVQDLTYGLSDFPSAGGITLARDTGQEEPEDLYTGEDLANLIKASVHKHEWEEADGKSIQFQNGLLIVRNSREVHTAVRKFFARLRSKLLEPPCVPGKGTIALFRELTGPDPEARDRAERRITDLGRDVMRARSSLERALNSNEGELRARARILLHELRERLGSEAVRDTLTHD